MSTNPDSCTSEVTNTTIKLGNAPRGSGHDNFLHGVIVSFDLTFTNKAWVEFQRYHFAEIISSQSSMHRITRFDLDKAYIDYVDERIIAIMKEKVSNYNSDSDKTKEERQKEYLEILYSNPAGMFLTAQVVTNYGQLKTMYLQRKNHKLPEWREFCRWIETLPMFRELCLKGDE